jgi:hypothetical protein
VSDVPVPPLEFQQLQPVLLRDGLAWVPGEAAAAAELVLPAGGRLPLRPFCPVTTLADHSRRAKAPVLLAHAMAETPLQPAPDQAVAAFLGVIVPGLEQWDAKVAVPAGPPEGGIPATLPDVVRLLPRLELPQPSVLLFGRYWLLSEGADVVRSELLWRADRWSSRGSTAMCATSRLLGSPNP